MSNVLLPKVVIAGPTNSGKSTLFNGLIGNWAITSSKPHTTRDPNRVIVNGSEFDYLLVDTAGAVEKKQSLPLERQSARLARQELDSADLALICYSRDIPIAYGLLAYLADKKIPHILIQCKCDSPQSILFSQELQVSAAHNFNLDQLKIKIEKKLKQNPNLRKNKTRASLAKSYIIMGQPNAGKSTLINYLAGDDILLVHNLAGTTRDLVPVTIEIQQDNQIHRIILYDSAGLTKASISANPIHAQNPAHNFGLMAARVIKNKITNFQGVIMLVDIQSGINRQILRLLRTINAYRIKILIVLNKIDLLDESYKHGDQVIQNIIQTHPYLSRFNFIAVSAINGTGADKLKKWLINDQSIINRSN